MAPDTKSVIRNQAPAPSCAGDALRRQRNAAQRAAVAGRRSAIVGLVVLLTPRLWKRVERFDTGPDYRIPYQLSKDYWLYRAAAASRSPTRSNVVVLGDSVVWGEYVLPGRHAVPFPEPGSGAAPDRFVNGGVNGLFPLAHGGAGRLLRRQRCAAGR